MRWHILQSARANELCSPTSNVWRIIILEHGLKFSKQIVDFFKNTIRFAHLDVSLFVAGFLETEESRLRHDGHIAPDRYLYGVLCNRSVLTIKALTRHSPEVPCSFRQTDL